MDEASAAASSAMAGVRRRLLLLGPRADERVGTGRPPKLVREGATLWRRIAVAVCLLLVVVVSIPLALTGDARSHGQVYVIETELGEVQGIELSDGVDAWLGIPYATAGRFDIPSDPPKWSHRRSGQHSGPACPQLAAFGFDLSDEPQSEGGCLVLNVYAGSVAHAARKRMAEGYDPETLSNVLVFLHGGGFVAGSVAQSEYAAQALVRDSGAMVVEVQSRLGALGYLAHPAIDKTERGTSGNWGLLDQQWALRWVQRNIRAFGGSPRNVTLVGQGAGGNAALLQLSLVGSNGLFTGAVVDSGSLPSRLQTCTQLGQGYGVRLTVAAGCANDGRDPGSAAALACLRGLSAARILQAQDDIGGTQQGAWSPCSDSGMVLPGDPTAVFRDQPSIRGKLPGGLWLGSARNDTSPLLAYSVSSNAGSITAITPAQFRSAVQDAFPGLNATTIEGYYTAIQPLQTQASSENFRLLSALTSDGLLTCANRRIASAAFAAGVPAFSYSLDYAIGFVGRNFPPYGACRFESLSFLFGDGCFVTCDYLSGDLTPAEVDLGSGWRAAVGSLTTRRNPAAGPGVGVFSAWEAIGSGDGRYLSIDVPAARMQSFDDGWASACTELWDPLASGTLLNY